jgi:hypothetical protein
MSTSRNRDIIDDSELTGEKNIPNGIAGLDGSGKLDPSVLPVDMFALKRNNYVLVKTKADLPTPIAGVILLVANTLYEINGTISLGTDRISMAENSVLAGRNANEDVITSTYGSVMVSIFNVNCTISNLSVSNLSTGGGINVNNSGSETVIIEKCKFYGANMIAGISVTKSAELTIIRNNDFTDVSGVLINGATNKSVVIKGNNFNTDANTYYGIRLSSGTTDSVDIQNNTFYMDDITSVCIDVVGTFTPGDSVLIVGNRIGGVGLGLVGATFSTDKFFIPYNSNVGIEGLSLTLASWRAGRNSANVTNTYLRDGTVPTNQSPFIVKADANITSIAVSTNGVETWTAEIYINGVLTHSEAITAVDNQIASLDIDVNAGDKIGLRCLGTNINRPTIEVFYKLR